jgi:hypothetical protein
MVCPPQPALHSLPSFTAFHLFQGHLKPRTVKMSSSMPASTAPSLGEANSLNVFIMGDWFMAQKMAVCSRSTLVQPTSTRLPASFPLLLLAGSAAR